MKVAWSVSLAVVAVFALVIGLQAAEKKNKANQVTLKGTIECAKCALGESDSCATVIKVDEGDTKGTYYFDAKGHKAHHSEICKKPTEGSVTGVISADGDKKVITVSKVEYAK